MGSFPKMLGSCFPFKPAAEMGFCWLAEYCLCCAGSLVALWGGLWKGIWSHFHVFEGASGSGSLLKRGLFPLVYCASLHSVGLLPVITCRFAL